MAINSVGLKLFSLFSLTRPEIINMTKADFKCIHELIEEYRKSEEIAEQKTPEKTAFTPELSDHAKDCFCQGCLGRALIKAHDESVKKQNENKEKETIAQSPVHAKDCFCHGCLGRALANLHNETVKKHQKSEEKETIAQPPQQGATTEIKPAPETPKVCSTPAPAPETKANEDECMAKIFKRQVTGRQLSLLHIQVPDVDDEIRCLTLETGFPKGVMYELHCGNLGLMRTTENLFDFNNYPQCATGLYEADEALSLLKQVKFDLRNLTNLWISSPNTDICTPSVSTGRFFNSVYKITFSSNQKSQDPSGNFYASTFHPNDMATFDMGNLKTLAISGKFTLCPFNDRIKVIDLPTSFLWDRDAIGLSHRTFRSGLKKVLVRYENAEGLLPKEMVCTQYYVKY